MAEKKNSINEAQIIKMMDDFFKKAPQLPSNIRELLVKIAPWFALVFGIWYFGRYARLRDVN